MNIPALLQWLEASTLAILIQQTAYGFVVAVAVHLLGLTLSVGTLLWVDLRMMGVALRTSDLRAVYRGLAPWFLAGFVVMFASGAALFTAFATAAYESVFFRIKMAAIALAAVNALAFHFVALRQVDDTGDARPPPAVRAAGFASLLLWTAVILCGRMMSYTIF